MRPLRPRLTLYILFQEEMLAIEDGVGEQSDPVAKDKHPCLWAKIQVELDVQVALEDVVHIAVGAHILLGEAH